MIGIIGEYNPRTPKKGKAGAPPVPYYIRQVLEDGRRGPQIWCESMKHLSIEVNAGSHTYHKLREAIRLGGTYTNYLGETYEFSKEPWGIPKSEPKRHFIGQPLISQPVTHRIGYSEARI